METKETKVVKTKTKVWKGKSYTINLTEEDVTKMRKSAEVCKLNGHDFEYYKSNMLTWVMSEDWPEVAASVFAESNPELKVGLGATMNLYSDKRAMTIVEVVTPKKIIVQENKTECLDYYAGRYKVLDSLCERMSKHTFTLRKGGTWVEEGQPKKYGSVTLTVGFRRHFIDPSF